MFLAQSNTCAKICNTVYIHTYVHMMHILPKPEYSPFLIAYNLFRAHIRMAIGPNQVYQCIFKESYIRGHSTTTWTKFYPISWELICITSVHVWSTYKKYISLYIHWYTFQVARLFYVLQLSIQLGCDKNIHYMYISLCHQRNRIDNSYIVYTILFKLLSLRIFMYCNST